MAKVKACDLSKIGRYGDTLDFYYWKGILCVRTYPRKARQPGTPAQMNTWEALRYANVEFNRLAQPERDAFKFLASPSQMSGRDLFLKIVLEEYQGRGENLCRIQIRMEPATEDSVRICLTKSCNAPVLLAGLTPQDKERYLEWLEITPILRGKKMLRRWDLVDHTEDATVCAFIPQEQDYFETIVFLESGVRYVTARTVIQIGGGYGRAGLYEL